MSKKLLFAESQVKCNKVKKNLRHKCLHDVYRKLEKSFDSHFQDHNISPAHLELVEAGAPDDAPGLTACVSASPAVSPPSQPWSHALPALVCQPWQSKPLHDCQAAHQARS